VLPFPIEVFPERLQRYCRQLAAAMLAPLDFVGAAMLAVAGAAIGQSINIKLKRGWFETALLYIILVARPGKTKTPPSRAVAAPLSEIDKRLRKESDEKRQEWLEKKKAHDKGDSAPPGPEPPQLRAIVKDITRESLALILRDNPRGVLCDPDEASAWVASFNEYKGKGGADRQFWLSNHNSAPISVDRKGGRESIHVPFPFVSVLGGLPPGKLTALRDERGQDDGMVERILPGYPEEFPPQGWTEAELSEETEQLWSAVIELLFSVPMCQQDGGRRPYVAEFTPGGKRRWVDWFNAHAAEMDDPALSDCQAGAWSKMRMHAGRFALIMSRLRWACSVLFDRGISGNSWREAQHVLADPATLELSVKESDVDGAVKLAAYFKSHVWRVIHRLNGGIDEPDVRAVAGWIRRKRLATFREADVGNDLRRFRNRPELLGATLKSLAECGVIRPKKESHDPHAPGRKPTPTYDVHPDFLDAPENTGNTDNGPFGIAAENSGSPATPISGISSEFRRSQEQGAAPDPEPAPDFEEGDI
jgi:hypothetical protein